MTDLLVTEGVELAKRGNALTWEWARWAYKVGGPLGEAGNSNGATQRIDETRTAVVKASGLGLDGLPKTSSLLVYRQAAEALPDRQREAVISVEAARELYRVSPVERERVIASFNGDKITPSMVEKRIAELHAADVPDPDKWDRVPSENAEQIPGDAVVELFVEQPANDEDVVEEAKQQPAKPKPVSTFNQVNDNIGWAKWSWNPVTGCLHNCEYCYARDIANRFYPQGFKPTFLPERLDAPQNTKVPAKADENPAWRRVFTCSMADLFGKWVPQEWIDRVFEQIVAAPQWEFLCLTKFPQRLAELDWPDNTWVGTTVDKQHRVDLAQRHFAEVKAGVKWLSCEPMLEPLKFDSLEMFDWVVIGSCTASSGMAEFAPPFDWVVDLYQQAREAGCKVYLKHNLFGSKDGAAPGMQSIREWPR